MDKILISWCAMKNDFNGNQVATDGPTYRFHQYFYETGKYEKHILLTTEAEHGDQIMGLKVFTEITKKFRAHNIELKYADIAKEEIINYNTVYSKLHTILSKYKSQAIDAFISPGTATMQVVWYMLCLENKFNIRLLQTVRPEQNSDGVPKLIEIKLDSAPFAQFLLQYERAIEVKGQKSLDYVRNSKSLQPIYKLVDDIALTKNTTVLIRGETGTGKEDIAQQIHAKSSRWEKPIICVNCAAISPDLLESRLFGHEKGAFTGATEKRDGYFQSANGGTIFLDEIGDINPYMQVALLRVLQNREVQKVGSTKADKIDVRVITATNKDLYEECIKGTFRWDLYYRLCVAEIVTPTVRTRGKEEIRELLEFFNQKTNRLLENTRPLITFTSDTMKILLNHSWPGNVREIENFIERCYAYGLTTVTPQELPVSITKNLIQSQKLEDVKRNHVEQIVRQCNGNLNQAKEILGLGSVNTVKSYLENKGDSNT